MYSIAHFSTLRNCLKTSCLKSLEIYVKIKLMKKKLILIGGGTIAAHYKTGLINSPHYELVALHDINPDCASRNLFPVPFFTDLDKALDTGAEVALISTTTSSHYQIAKQLLERGISVITEKPMCESYGKVEELFALANTKKVDLGCLFHWKYADEVLYLKAHRAQIGQIEHITVHVCDDYAYTVDGSIRTDRKGLCGAWLDSGINILSYVGQLCDLSKKPTLTHDRLLTDEVTGQVKFANRIYRFGETGETTVDITVDWRTASREKISEIVCEGGVIFVNHTAQTVLWNGMPVYQNPTDDRLSAHYTNAFAEYELDKDEQQRTLLLHRILFEGGAH